MAVTETGISGGRLGAPTLRVAYWQKPGASKQVGNGLRSCIIGTALFMNNVEFLIGENPYSKSGWV